MAYYLHDNDPTAYANGYALILPDCKTIWFKPDTPPDIKERFTKDWQDHLDRKAAEEKRGIFSDTW